MYGVNILDHPCWFNNSKNNTGEFCWESEVWKIFLVNECQRSLMKVVLMKRWGLLQRAICILTFCLQQSIVLLTVLSACFFLKVQYGWFLPVSLLAWWINAWLAVFDVMEWLMLFLTWWLMSCLIGGLLMDVCCMCCVHEKEIVSLSLSRCMERGLPALFVDGWCLAWIADRLLMDVCCMCHVHEKEIVRRSLCMSERELLAWWWWWWVNETKRFNSLSANLFSFRMTLFRYLQSTPLSRTRTAIWLVSWARRPYPVNLLVQCRETSPRGIW